MLFFGEQVEEREPILRARIKVSPQMMKAIAVLASKHVREYEEAVGPITLPEQVYAAWEVDGDGARPLIDAGGGMTTPDPADENARRALRLARAG